MTKTYTGSAKELADKIAFNGKRLTAPMLSILSMLGIAVTVVQKADPAGGKGKKINVLEVKGGTFTVELTDFEGEIVRRPRGEKKRRLDAEAAARAAAEAGLIASTETETTATTETDGIDTVAGSAPVDNEVQSVEHDAEPVAQAA